MWDQKQPSLLLLLQYIKKKNTKHTLSLLPEWSLLMRLIFLTAPPVQQGIVGQFSLCLQCSSPVHFAFLSPQLLSHLHLSNAYEKKKKRNDVTPLTLLNKYSLFLRCTFTLPSVHLLWGFLIYVNFDTSSCFPSVPQIHWRLETIDAVKWSGVKEKENDLSRQEPVFILWLCHCTIFIAVV